MSAIITFHPYGEGFMKRLTPDQVSAYQRDGFLKVEGVFSPEECQQMKVTIQKILEEVRAEWRAQGKDPAELDNHGVFVGLSVRHPFFREIARREHLLDMLEDLIGPSIGFLSDKVVFKAEKKATPWHQDWPYWKGSHKISVWIALDRAIPENGCLKFIPGSHQKPIEHHQVHQPREGFGFRIIALDESNAVTVPAEVGTAVFFHDLTLHSSHPNQRGEDRFALVITYRDLSQPDLDYPWLPAAAPVRTPLKEK